MGVKNLGKFLTINFDYIGVDKEFGLDMSNVDIVGTREYVQVILDCYRALIADHVSNVYGGKITSIKLENANKDLKKMTKIFDLKSREEEKD